MFIDPRRNIKDIVNEIDNSSLTYKNVDILSNFLNEQGKILPRRVTGLTSKQQKNIVCYSNNAISR